MFSDVVVLHGAECQSASTGVGSSPILPGGERNVCSSEKMTQTGKYCFFFLLKVILYFFNRIYNHRGW